MNYLTDVATPRFSLSDQPQLGDSLSRWTNPGSEGGMESTAAQDGNLQVTSLCTVPQLASTTTLFHCTAKMQVLIRFDKTCQALTACMECTML